MTNLGLQYFGGRSSGGSRSSAKEIGEYEDAQKYFDKEVNRWQNSLTEEEMEALIQYGGGEDENISFDMINNALWSGKADKYKEQIELLDKAISKFNLKEDIVVYRGTDGVDFDLSKGSVISLKGYSSTSTNLEVARTYTSEEMQDYFEKPVIFEITVPKGKGKAAYTANQAMAPEESEVLLKRNSKLQITGQKKRKGQTIITAKML